MSRSSLSLGALLDSLSYICRICPLRQELCRQFQRALHTAQSVLSAPSLVYRHETGYLLLRHAYHGAAQPCRHLYVSERIVHRSEHSQHGSDLLRVKVALSAVYVRRNAAVHQHALVCLRIGAAAVQYRYIRISQRSVSVSLSHADALRPRHETVYLPGYHAGLQNGRVGCGAVLFRVALIRICDITRRFVQYKQLSSPSCTHTFPRHGVLGTGMQLRLGGVLYSAQIPHHDRPEYAIDPVQH